MRQLYILACLLTFASVSAFGQFWNKPNSQYTFQWFWSYAGIGDETILGFKQLTIDSDTVIDGKTFKRYRDYSVSYNGGSNSFDSAYFDTTSVLTSIAFYEADSILYAHHVNMDTNSVIKLYDFSALPGESWSIPQIYLDATDPWNYYCDTQITVNVLDTGHLMFQGSSLYFLEVEYHGLENYVTATHDTIFERFGSKKFSFLSISKQCSLYGPVTFNDKIYNLTCYNDNDISLGENCTYFDVVNVNEVDIDKFSIYPNPSNTVVRIQTRSKQIYLTDFLGKVLFTVTTKNDNADIDISGLTDGVYFLTTTDGYTNKLIVQY